MLKESEILELMQQDISSTMKSKARVGMRYYEGRHDILDYRMFYFNADGELVEDRTRNNARIPHPFFTELVDQEVQYMLSGGQYAFSDIPELQAELDERFCDEFNAELADTMTDAVSLGFGYMHAYRADDDTLKFESADAMGVVEVREKDTDDGCAYVIYWYVDRVAKTNKEIKRIQVYDDELIWYYVQEDGQSLKLDDSERINPRPHVIYSDGDSKELYYENFGYIPFFRLDNSKKQRSGIDTIKSLIDDYDMMSCGLSNNLADFDNPIHVVRGFEGDNLDELQANLKTKKLIGVDSDGGVEVHTVNIPYQARQAKMEEDEKNIYRFGMGFNSAQLGDGNITNIVIKSRYALLDLKCNKLEVRLKKFLRQVLDAVLADINRLNGTRYEQSDVRLEFDREVMTNAFDNAQMELVDAQRQQTQVNTLLSLATTVDDETIIQRICDTLDLDFEEVMERVPDDGLGGFSEAVQALDGEQA